MLQSTNKVSIIILSRGGGQPLVNTLESISNQTYKNIEVFLIVSEKDEKLSRLVYPYRDLIAFTLRQKDHSTPRLLNAGLKIAKGKYFAVIAAGDVWQPRALAEKVNFLEKNMDAFAVCCDFDIFDKNKVINDSIFRQKKIFQAEEEQQSAFLMEEGQSFLINNCSKLFSNVLMRKQAYSFYGPYDENMDSFADFELALKILNKHKLGCINKVMVSKFFDAYKVAYYINTNIKERISFFEYLLAYFRARDKKHQRAVRNRIKRSYFYWADYLIKNDEIIQGRRTALDYMSKYEANLGFFWLVFKSAVKGAVDLNKGKYNYFRMEALRDDLLRLNF